MLRLYGAARSRAVRALWMLGELGLNYDHKDYLPRAPETRTPEFRALNPNGRVPVIDDDGFVLSESMAINFYLAKKHESPLYPSDPKNEALALQWSLWETRPARPPDRELRQAYHGVSGGRAQKGDRRGRMAGSNGIVRRAGDCARESGVACRPGIFSRRSERRCSTLPCTGDRYQEMAPSADLAAPLLGAPGSKASPRHAGRQIEPG